MIMDAKLRDSMHEIVFDQTTTTTSKWSIDLQYICIEQPCSWIITELIQIDGSIIIILVVLHDDTTKIGMGHKSKEKMKKKSKEHHTKRSIDISIW